MMNGHSIGEAKQSKGLDEKPSVNFFLTVHSTN